LKTTEQSYRLRLDRVTAFLHANLETDIGIDALSEVACLSSYHWHRIYTAMSGETVATTLRRLRLQRAADRLANSDMAISKIAGLAQYGSQDAFSRAFRDTYSKTPAAYRAGGSHAAFKAAHARADAEGFDVTIVHLNAVRCISVPHNGPYLQIDAAMGALFGKLAQSELLGPDTSMQAVFYDDPDLVAEADLQSAACVPCASDTPLPDGTEELLRPAGTYAKLTYTGPYADMKDAYRWLYGVWLPNSGCEISERPGFEAYLNSPVDTKPEQLRTDIFLPVEVQS
jgi:AraC family transcriptional regulator